MHTTAICTSYHTIPLIPILIYLYLYTYTAYPQYYSYSTHMGGPTRPLRAVPVPVQCLSYSRRMVEARRLHPMTANKRYECSIHPLKTVYITGNIHLYRVWPGFLCQPSSSRTCPRILCTLCLITMLYPYY